MRKLLTAAAAVLAIGGAAVATGASAYPAPHGYGYGYGRGYDRGYEHDYRGHVGRGFYEACRAHFRWDRYAGRYVRVEACF